MVKKEPPLPVQVLMKIIDEGNISVDDGKKFVGGFGLESYFVLLPKPSTGKLISIYARCESGGVGRLFRLFAEFRFAEIIFPYFGCITSYEEGLPETLYYCSPKEAMEFFKKLKLLYKK